MIKALGQGQAWQGARPASLKEEDSYHCNSAVKGMCVSILSKCTA